MNDNHPPRSTPTTRVAIAVIFLGTAAFIWFLLQSGVCQ